MPVVVGKDYKWLNGSFLQKSREQREKMVSTHVRKGALFAWQQDYKIVERWEGKLSSRCFKRHNCPRVCQNNIIQGILHVCRLNKAQQKLQVLPGERKPERERKIKRLINKWQSITAYYHSAVECLILLVWQTVIVPSLLAPQIWHYTTLSH